MRLPSSLDRCVRGTNTQRRDGDVSQVRMPQTTTVSMTQQHPTVADEQPRRNVVTLISHASESHSGQAPGGRSETRDRLESAMRAERRTCVCGAALECSAVVYSHWSMVTKKPSIGYVNSVTVIVHST